MSALNKLEDTTYPKVDTEAIDRSLASLARRLEQVEKNGKELSNEDLKEQIQIDELKKLVSGLVSKIN